MFCGIVALHRSAQGRADGAARRPYLVSAAQSALDKSAVTDPATVSSKFLNGLPSMDR